MSNASLELGGDNWAAKDGNLLGYAVGDSSGKYVPREFTFTRGSNLAATRVAANGLIEKGRENLLENSVWDGVTTDTKPTGWTFQLVSGTGTFDVTATEGQIRFQTLDASSRAFIYSPTITTNGIVVASVYVDEVTTAMPLSELLTRTANATALFAYEDGVQINYYSDNVQAGKRYSVVFNKTASTNFRFGVGVSSGTLGDIVLSRPQIEVGLVATELIVSPVGSTGLAGLLEDEPRIDYTGGTGSLLLEPIRTNLIGQSEYFGDSSWTKTGGTSVATNSITSPDGTQNASTITGLSGTGSNDLRFGTSINPANKTYTASVYLKGSGTLRIQMSNNVDNAGSTIVTLTSSWVRYELTKTFNATAGALALTLDDSGATAAGYDIFGAQLEEGSYPTSYIPNHSGGSVTRDEEGQLYYGFSSLIGQAEGTLFLDIENSSDGTEIFSLNRSTTNSIFLLASGGSYRAFIYTDGTTISVQTSVNVSDRIKIAIAYESNNWAIYANGLQVYTNNAQTWTPNVTIDVINLNKGGYAASKGKVQYNQALIFEGRLSNADLETLTTL